ncbi:MAG: tetratricopeptide repeat protein [Thermodesulfobacteriota bacterium]|nr:tetratricopeptide repeat protein [Thermodesulfobacteriota bacterium]
MTFEYPYILLWIWAVLLLLGLYLIGRARRRRILGRYATDEGLSRITGQASDRRRRFRALLLMITFVLLVIALAGPRYGYRWEKIEQKGVDIVVALDCSKSMLAGDVDPSRLQRAKREIIDLLGILAGDRIGLVAFAGNAFIQCPLTMDKAAFQIFLKALGPGYLPVGGSNLVAALDTSLSAFDPQSPADRAIILITDGEHTAGGDPLISAEKIKNQNIKVFCIGVGHESGVPVPGDGKGFKKDKSGKIVLTRLDEAVLKDIARITGGAYVRSVAGDMDLDVIYHDHIRTAMTAATLKSGKKRVWENRFQWFVGLGLLCLGIAMAMPPVKRGLFILPVLAMLASGAPTAHAGTVYGDVQQGRNAYRNGAYEKALKHFIDAQLKDPDNPSLYYNIGNAYYKTGQYDEAQRHYEKAFSLATDGALKEKSLYNRGNSHFRSGQYQKAIDAYQKTLALNPEDREAKDNLELARQALRQQKQQQQKSNGDHSKNRNEDKDGNSSRQEKQDQQHENGDENKAADGKDNQKKDAQQQPSTKPEDNQPPGQQPQHPAGKDAGQKKDDGEQQTQSVGSLDRTERRLNRLKDKPGAAMVPVYRGETVEKDW